jgi:hypothetical protein
MWTLTVLIRGRGTTIPLYFEAEGAAKAAQEAILAQEMGQCRVTDSGGRVLTFDRMMLDATVLEGDQ